MPSLFLIGWVSALSPNNIVLAGEIYQEWVVNAVKRLKAFPSLFVQEGKTPFIHTALYNTRLPTPLKDALLVCALYKEKNGANEAWISTCINSRADHILGRLAQNRSMALEQLSFLQALILYQIIRFFDGDIGQRSRAERTDPIMSFWTKQLQWYMKDASAVDLVTESDQ